MAYVLEKQNRLEDAEREYKEAIRLAPESAVPYNGLSAVLFSRGKYKDAVKACREAISRYQLRDRFLGLFYVQLAIAQFQQGHKDEALEAVGRAKALGVAQHDAYSTIEKGKPAKKKG
jgi:tetratricopeptide (TPR) repeat protein